MGAVLHAEGIVFLATKSWDFHSPTREQSQSDDLTPLYRACDWIVMGQKQIDDFITQLPLVYSFFILCT